MFKRAISMDYIASVKENLRNKQPFSFRITLVYNVTKFQILRRFNRNKCQPQNLLFNHDKKCVSLVIHTVLVC